MANVLQQKRPDTEKITARISPDTHKELEALYARIEAVAPHLHFTVDDVVEKAVRSAVKKANRELNTLKGNLE